MDRNDAKLLQNKIIFLLFFYGFSKCLAPTPNESLEPRLAVIRLVNITDNIIHTRIIIIYRTAGISNLYHTPRQCVIYMRKLRIRWKPLSHYVQFTATYSQSNPFLIKTTVGITRVVYYAHC